MSPRQGIGARCPSYNGNMPLSYRENIAVGSPSHIKYTVAACVTMGSPKVKRYIPALPPAIHGGCEDEAQDGPEAAHHRFAEYQTYEKGNCGAIRFDAAVLD